MRWTAVTAAGLVLAAGAGPAAATQWVTYSFAGTGTATYFDAKAAAGLSAPRAVTFSGQATVDLDAVAGGGWSGTEQAPYATDTARAGEGGAFTLRAATSPLVGSYRQNWSAAALLPAGYGADGRFPVFAGTAAAGGAVTFDLGTKFTDWVGTGRLSSLSVQAASGPAPWSFQVADQPVPEPATWALLVAGFGAVGWAARRRYVRWAIA